MTMSPADRQRPDAAAEAAEGDEGDADASGARIGRRRIFVEARGALAEADIYDFTKLAPGNRPGWSGGDPYADHYHCRPTRPERPHGRLSQHRARDGGLRPWTR